MNGRLHWPSTALPSALAGLTTWVTLLAWTKFAEHSSGYLVPIFGGCVLVAVTGMLLRATRLPALVVALAQVVVLALWLHHRWAGGVALGGWLPSGASVDQVVETLRASAVAAGQYAAPIPKTVPQFYPLMVLMGCVVAVLVDFLACGLRKAPLAGLPLLAVYTAPVSILDGGVSWLKFALAAMCFLLLIASEEAQRLSHWGHQLTPTSRLFDSQATSVRPQAVWSSARKIGLTATGLAVLVPIIVPTLSTSIFEGNGSGPGGNGNTVSIANPMVDMKRDLTRGVDVELLRVTTPDPDPSYLRISVLDQFDGQSWSPSGRNIPVAQRADGRVPRPAGLDAGVPTRHVPYEIETSSYFRSRWLPAPYPTYSIHAAGDWRYDRSTLDFISAANNQTAAGLTYRLQGLDITPTAAELVNADPAPASIFGPETKLPDNMPESVAKLARTVTEGSKTKFEMAVRLQRWFRVDGRFRYSLQRAPGNGIDELVHFLGTGKGSRVGYCEQFAAAMAVMGRTLSIPSRVAVGFLRPAPTSGKNTYIFSSHDLHAWPEMYFQGVGWVRFEPTPQARTGEAPAYTRADLSAPQPSLGSAPSAALPTQNRVDQQSAAPGRSSKSGGGGGSWQTGEVLLDLLVLLAVLAALALPRFVRGWLRRRRWSSATTPAALSETGWAELRATAVDLGMAWDDTVTLRSQARRLVRSFARPDAEEDEYTRLPHRGPAANPEATAALDRLVRQVERARYATGTSRPSATAGQVRRDTEACTEALRAGAGRRRRTRATWLPASLWRTGPSTERGSTTAPLPGEPAGVDHAV